MDNSSKLAKVRGKASRKKPPLQSAPESSADSPSSQFPKWPGSPSSRSNEDSDVWNTFRPRTSSNASTISAPVSAAAAQSVQLGSPVLLSSASPAPLGLNSDRLPTDLDMDMYMENLECDMDYIINSELMDGGLDFNFEPILPTPSYPSTSQASNHTWVPS
uniref:FOXO protein transactivation domain-containing protein n=1 Tax=Malurus cyaneus samueli TaxID=2593467 RepID=A0A8C5UG27_9PASS